LIDASRKSEESALAHFLFAGKRSSALAPDEEQDRADFARRVARSDAVIVDDPDYISGLLGCALTDWALAHPAVAVTILTPFGWDGTDRGAPASDLTVSARGGLLHTTGSPHREPLKQGGYQTAYQAGSIAAVATLGVLLGVQRGQMAGVIDCSALEAVSTMLDPNIYWNTVDPDQGGRWAAMSRRLGNQSPGAPRGLWPCKDGWVMVIPRLDRNVEALAELTGDERFRDPRFQTLDGQSTHADEIVALLIPWLLERSRDELYHLGQDAGHYFGYLVTVDELSTLPQLKAREFFQVLEHPDTGPLRYPGGPARLSATPWTVERAPRLNEHGDDRHQSSPTDRAPGRLGGELPLNGIKVVDLTRAWAGPLATKLLADLGADVVKVHAVRVNDRRWDPTRSAYWRYLDGNKRSIGIDITSPDGGAVLNELVREAGCLVENFSPRVLPKLGMGYEDLIRVRPDLVMVSMPGFGNSGPDRNHRALGETIEALSGLMSLQGYRDEDAPMKSGVNYGDPIAGVTGALAALAALFHRQRTGEGQYVEVSHLEAAVNWLGEWVLAHSADGTLPRRNGNGSLRYAPEGVYPVLGDDAWLSLSAPSDEQWLALADTLELPEALRALDRGTRLEQRDHIDGAIAERTALVSGDQVVTELLARGVPAAVVSTAGEVIGDPIHARRGFWEPVALTDGPVPEYLYQRAPFLLTARSTGLRRPPPTFSQHLREVLRSWAGRSDAEIDGLIERHAVAEAPINSEGQDLRL
jgi:crotonobetainyl-CoA:carnitine CoA-transferase CaiB-like acyl-CoA transferase